MPKPKPHAQEPARQGFYAVTLVDDTELIAEWREIDKKQGKRWWQYVSDDPTLAKTPVPLDGVADFRPAKKADVDALLRRTLSVEEKIEEAYQSFLNSGDSRRVSFPVPDNRRVRVGDALEIGLLREAKVVELREEERIIIFSYREINHNYGSPVDNGIKYRAIHWTGVLAKATQTPTELTLGPRMFNAYRSSTLDSVINRALRGVDDAPDYQRGYAWSAQDKERFLDSVFAGRELGRFIFIRRGYPHADQILDGKQRLTCLLEFVTSQIAYKGVYWHELGPRDRDRIENRSIQFADLDQGEFKRSDFLQIFLEVNAAGVPQTEEHLAHVRAMLEEELAREASQGNAG